MEHYSKKQYIMVIIACGGLAICALGLIPNVNGIFFGPVSEALGVGRGAVSLAATLTMIFTGFMGPASVKAVQRYPMKRLVFASIIATALCTVGMAYSGTILLYDVFSIMRGITSAFFGVPVITMLMGNWFIKNRGMFTGAVMGCSGLAGAILSPVLSRVITARDYKTAYILCAALMILFSLPAWFFLDLSPEKLGEKAYGEGHLAEQKGPREKESVLDFKKISVVYISLLLVAFFCQSVCSVSQHLAGYAESVGQGSMVGAMMISAAMIGNILAKFTAGVLSDLMGAMKSAVALVTAFWAGLLLLVLAPGHLWALYVGAFLLGTSYACAVMLSNMSFALYGTKQYGSAYSVLTIVLNTGGALAVTIIGYGYDLFHSYALILWAGIGITTASLVLLFVIAVFKKKQLKK